ncbi:MAG: tyrosine-type recombinase/integrase [Gammaproteobacteria bacterium]
MARLTRDAKLETREARSRLRQRIDPYWRSIHPGLAVGYYKGKFGGTWYVRRLVAGAYVKQRLGDADDYGDADGREILTFADAQRRALREELPLRAGARTQGMTVADALSDWQQQQRAKSRLPHPDLHAAAQVRLVIEALGDRPVADLTTAEIEAWRDSIANSNRRVRVKKPANEAMPAIKRVPPPDDLDPREAKRRRQATANRLLNVLKAALNRAWRQGRLTSDTEWRRVKPFANVDQPRLRFLSKDECRRLLNAAPPDFRRLAYGTLYTGLRVGELCSLRAEDIGGDALRVWQSKSGKSRSVPLSSEGQRFFDELRAGKRPEAPLFLRKDGQPWHRTGVSRAMREVSTAARLEPPAKFHDLRRTYASLLINAGASAETIQKLLGHSDTRMTLRVYAHLLDSTLAKEVESKLPSFGFEPGNVRTMHR